MEFNKNNIPLHTDNKKEHNNVSFERNKKDKEQEKLKEERIRYEKERLKLEKMISRRIEKADKKEKREKRKNKAKHILIKNSKEDTSIIPTIPIKQFIDRKEAVETEKKSFISKLLETLKKNATIRKEKREEEKRRKLIKKEQRKQEKLNRIEETKNKKNAAVKLLKDNDIPILNCKCFTLKDYNESAENIIDSVEKEFAYPVIVKPVNLGSSVGIQIAKNKEELIDSLEDAFSYSRKILVEKAIKNLKEVNCSVVGDYESAEASECEEPIKTDEILSFNDKYISGNKKLGGTKSMNAGVLKLPADISPDVKQTIQKLSIKTFKVLGCSGVIRIDFMIDKDTNAIYVNEVNTIPGSLSFHLWKAANLNYTDLLDKLIDLSLKRNREEKNLTFSFDSNILSGVSLNGLKGTKGMKM